MPSVFSFVTSSPLKRKGQQQLCNYERRRNSKKVRLECCDSEVNASNKQEVVDVEDTVQGSCDSEINVSVGTQTFNVSKADASVMTDISMDGIEAMQRKRYSSNDEWSEEALKSDNQRVRFYTGLPSFLVLMSVFNHVSAHHSHNNKFALSSFREFIITLMKLRLSLFDQDLAYRFGVHQTTISRIFHRWLNLMYVRLKPLVAWPSRDELRKSMPMDFRSTFPKCAVIIDCFEIFCERPYPLKARAQTYSDYKHHNTVKFLIGIAPQGVITFISKGWGGRVSDRYLTENCGILDHLLPGDQILADRGFTIQEIVALKQAEIKLPSFTRGKKQLSKLEVDSSRTLSRVRIHVERVIGLLRQKYTFLESTLPINMIMCNDRYELSVIDKIVIVCCALCNCCESVIPFE